MAMDIKQYNVWLRIGNQWNPVLNVTVTKVTAEALAALMSHENEVPYDDYRFSVSIGRPSSIGFEAEPTNISPANKTIR